MQKEKLRALLNSMSTDDQFFFARKCGTTVYYLRKQMNVGRQFGPDLAKAIAKESKRTKVPMRVDELRDDPMPAAKPRRRRVA